MHKAKFSWLLPLVAMLSAGIVWSLVIWTALEVSTIVLNTLHQIVELAGMK